MVLDLNNLTPEQTKRLNAISKENAACYTNYIDRLSKYNVDLLWWATPLASRDTDMCKAFGNFCIIKLIIEECARKDIDLVVVNDKVLYDSIKNIIGGKTSVVLSENKKAKVKRVFQGIYRVRNFVVFLRRIFEIKGHAAAFDFDKIHDDDKWIITYFIPAQFSETGYSDRYFNGIETAGERVNYVAMFDFLPGAGKKLAKDVGALGNVLALEKYVHLCDIWQLIRYIFLNFTIPKSEMLCDNIDIRKVILSELKSGKSNINSYYGILYASILSRLIVRQKIKINKCIIWHEGQPSSNYIIAHMRKNVPNANIVAYVITPMPEHWLQLSPTTYQVEKGICANMYALQGKAWVNVLRRFSDKPQYCIAPSFRHKYLFELENVYVPIKDSMLVVLPGNLNIASEFLRTVIEALKYEEKQYTVTIKNHPLNNNKKVNDYGIDDTEINFNVKYSKSTLQEELRDKEVVLMCDTTAVLEVAVQNIPFLVYVPNGSFTKHCDPADCYGIEENNLFYSGTELYSRLSCISEKCLKRNTETAGLTELFCNTTKENIYEFLK